MDDNFKNKTIEDDRVLGKHRGLVTNINDPTKSGRIKFRCPDVLGEYESDWALPCLPYAIQDGGFLFLPNIGDMVWVEFENGDPEKPIYTGYMWKTGNAPVNEDNKRVLIDKFKNEIIMTDKGTTVNDANKNSVIMNDKGNTILDFNGNSIVMDASGVRITGLDGGTIIISNGGISMSDASGNSMNMKNGSGISTSSECKISCSTLEVV